MTVSDLPIPDLDCPICKKKAVQRYKPFCSKRCADVDLNRWFTGSYAFSTNEEPIQNEENDEKI